jgi:hypothetical protein
MIRAAAFLMESTVASGFPRLSCGRPPVIVEWNGRLDGASRRFRLIARARVNRIPDRDGNAVSIRRPPTLEHRQGRDGVDRAPGDHLRVFVSIDVLFSDDDIAHEGLEHLGRHADVALQEVAQLRGRGDDVLFLDALHVRPPAGQLDLLEPLPFGRQLPAHLLRLGEHRVEVRVVELSEPLSEPLELPVFVGDLIPLLWPGLRRCGDGGYLPAGEPDSLPRHGAGSAALLSRRPTLPAHHRGARSSGTLSPSGA